MTWSSTDLVGKVFGRLTVLSRSENTKDGKARWLCACSCGNETIKRAVLLVKGSTTSCGCFSRQETSRRSKTHGRTYSVEWETWRRIRARCSNPRSEHWSDYGGRGIAVCERWLTFENFLSDMGPRPGPEYSIERVDVNLDYSPQNCIWATTEQQNRNKRSNVRIEHNGQCKTVAEWARDLGMSDTAIHDRLRRGWSPADAVSIGRRHRTRWSCRG